jgi:hypothetical protein
MTDTHAAEPDVASDTVAWSLGARSFSFEAAVALPLPVGASVLITSPQGRFLGQIVYKEPAGDPGHRRISGSGTLLARLAGGALVAVDGDEAFAGADLEPAPPDLVEAWYTSLAGARATLQLGTLRGAADQPAQLIAAGFNRHTFLCGQSGSGKTYTLGVILEQLLLNTTIPLVVLDPNSDYVHLDEITRPDGTRADVGRVLVFRADGPHRLQVRYGRLPLRQQAMVLSLDPVADTEAYDALRRASDALGTTEYSVSDIRRQLERTGGSAEHELARRIDNLGVAGWSIWAEQDDKPLLDQLGPDWRAAIADLGEIPSPEERSAIVAQILTGLWARRGLKQPVLIVIDEAHNVCPQSATDTNQALAIEVTARIAAEGRKYGLFLLLATQSPRKLNANVLSQCENLLLMKTNSIADVGHLAEVFSQVPSGLIGQATGFTLGEGLAAGRISPTPQLFRGGRRLSPEGGADLDTTWAEPAAR